MGFDLGLTDEQRALTQTLHEFADRVLRPAARTAESDRAVPRDIASGLHEIGVAAPVDESFGGGGSLDCVNHCLAAEELAWGDAGIAFHLLGSGLPAIVIGLAGSDEVRRKYLPGFAGPEPVRSFVAIGERFAAGDLDELETTIDDDKVRGEKYGVLNASEASFGVVVGRTEDGLGAVIVDGDSYEVIKPEDKMGLEAAPTAVLRFDCAGDALTTGPDLDRAILWSKLLVGAIAAGNARASLEYASSYATEREAFGKPIGAFQGVSFKIAEMAIAVEAARLSVLEAAYKIDRGTATYADVAEANGGSLTAAIRCGDDAVQILGGHGYIKDHPVEMWFRNAVTLSVFDAPDIVGDLAVSRGA
jgi:acyl-CoA dehydrogenase